MKYLFIQIRAQQRLKVIHGNTEFIELDVLAVMEW